MKIDYATAADVYDVALRMRESDYIEFDALSPTGSREELAARLADRFANRPDVLVARREDVPVAVGGLIEHRPNVVTLLFFATDDFNAVSGDISCTVKRILRRAKAAGTHRIEVVSLIGHKQAHDWIRWLGLREEGGPLRGFGKNGEAFQQFAWVADRL